MSNQNCLKNIIKKYQPNIITLQETWLHSFQQKDIENYMDRYYAHSKSLDEEKPLNQIHLPRGSAGVSTLTAHNLSAHMKKEEGSHRICITSVNNPDLIIINVYLPCRGQYSLEEFQQELDQVHEACQKYHSLPVILAGDFNIDLSGAQDSRTKYFKDFICINHLTEFKGIDTPTFTQHSGKGHSKIDYIFVNPHLHNIIESAKYEVLHVPFNSSAHTPIKLQITLAVNTNLPTSTGTKKKKRLAWSRADTATYREILSQYLCTDAPCTDTDLAIQYLTKALKEATNAAVPTIQRKVKKAPYNKEIAVLLKTAKKCFNNWVQAGRPDTSHPLTNQRKTANKNLRAAQRRQITYNRHKELDKLHNAAEDNPNLMFNLIKKQRGNNNKTTNVLMLDDQTHNGNLLPIWREHFRRLAIPQYNENFTEARITSAERDLHIIQDLQESSTLTIPITKGETHLAIKSLKGKKAADIEGLQAEHIKLASSQVAEFLTPAINNMFTTGSYPKTLKEGIKHPIPKKDKDTTDPGNHRGISICPIIGKILDRLHLQHQRIATDAKFHPLQFGFTEGRSCAHAAFIISESIAEAQDQSTPLYIAALDVQKAFDVVRHESLLARLHQLGLNGTWWKLKYSAYQDMSERVVWMGEFSDSFNILQGSRQGAYPSPEDYISHLSQLLHQTSQTSNGFSISGIDITAPTCADDMILMSTSPLQLQALLNLVATYANEEHYVIHPLKTVIVPFNIRSQEQLEHLMASSPWHINGNPVPVKHEVVHLGIRRNITNNNAIIEDRTSCMRRTLYSLHGSGLYGMSGLPVKTCLKLYNAYVLPRGLYGLEAVKISELGKAKLLSTSRQALRRILGLPERTAIPALHILSGQLPITYQLDIKILNFIFSLLAQEPSNNLIIRQYVMKKNSSNSLVNNMKNLLYKYGLPSLIDIFTNTTTKTAWKKLVKTAVTSKATEMIKMEAENKSTLQYLSKEFISGAIHPTINHVTNSRQVTRANIKARIVSGVYPFQSLQYKIQKSKSPLCLLCGLHDEDLHHFVLDCPALSHIRNKYHTDLGKCLPGNLYISQLQAYLDTRILQGAHLITEEDVVNIEHTTRDLLFALHTERTKLLILSGGNIAIGKNVRTYKSKNNSKCTVKTRITQKRSQGGRNKPLK